MDEVLHSKKLKPKQRAFLRAYVETFSITEAATAAGVVRQTHYDWMEDSLYKQAFLSMREPAIQSLEDVAAKRARAGSDTLLIFLLKGARPGVYRERYSMEHTGADGGPIETKDVSAREQIDSRIRRIIEREQPPQDS